MTSPAGGRGERAEAMQSFLDFFDIYLLEAVINGILLGCVMLFNRADDNSATMAPNLVFNR